jgi:hypothetical protein
VSEIWLGGNQLVTSPLQALPGSRHPVILKLSPDRDYVGTPDGLLPPGSRRSSRSILRALRLDPRTEQPWLANRYGGLSDRAVKPIGLSPLWAWQLRSLLHRIEAVSGKQCYSTQRHSRAAQPHTLPLDG